MEIYGSELPMQKVWDVKLGLKDGEWAWAQEYLKDQGLLNLGRPQSEGDQVNEEGSGGQKLEWFEERTIRRTRPRVTAPLTGAEMGLVGMSMDTYLIIKILLEWTSYKDTISTSNLLFLPIQVMTNDSESKFWNKPSIEKSINHSLRPDMEAPKMMCANWDGQVFMDWKLQKKVIQASLQKLYDNIFIINFHHGKDAQITV